MGKALSGKLSCPCDRSCYHVRDLKKQKINGDGIGGIENFFFKFLFSSVCFISVCTAPADFLMFFKNVQEELLHFPKHQL